MEYTEITQKYPNLKPWPHGISGNPNGNPGRISITSLARKYLESHPDEAARIAKKWVARSKKSDKALAQLLERTEGKVPQALVGIDGGPVQINFNVVRPVTDSTEAVCPLSA